MSQNPRDRREYGPLPTCGLREGGFLKLLRDIKLARHGILSKTRGSNINRDLEAFAMSCQLPLSSWINQVVTAFSPILSRPQASVLAQYSFGAILAQRCGLNSVATTLAPILNVCFSTIRSRLQEFYQPSQVKSGDHRRQLDVTTCFAPLLAWVLKDWPSTRLAVALDATSLGDRFTILSVSVVYRGSAIPVAWKVWPANVRHAWKPEWIALVQAFQAQIPSDWTVIVMTDRGLYARWLFQEIVALGWHPLMRINHASKFRPQGSRLSLPVTDFAPEMGRHHEGCGDAFPRRAQRRLSCTLLATWETGHDEAWFVLTDLPKEHCDALWYGMRGWIEHGFKLLKSAGWQWQTTRMTDPERAGRLWLVLAVATRYILAVGGEVDAAAWPVETIPEFPPATSRDSDSRKEAEAKEIRAQSERPAAADAPRTSATPGTRATGTKKRLVSVFRQGLAAILSILIAGHALPKPQWKPEPWLEIRAEYKTNMEQPPTPIPKNPSL
jgi:hypothetical protein